MKLYPILLSFAMLFLFATCKKEDGERKISLKTKKAKLAGNWRIASGKASITIPASYNILYVFEGGNVTINASYKDKYSLGLTINKDGTFSFKDIFLGETLEAKGSWNFNSGIGESKKKEELVFSIEEVQKGLTHGNNIFNRNCTNFVYKIEELANNKIIMSSSGKVMTNERGEYYTFSTNYVMIK